MAKWIYVASLSETRPRGLKKEEIAEYLAAPGEDITGLSGAIDELSKNCWYLDQLRSGSLFFNRVKNLNAQINSYFKMCSDGDRDDEIESKLKEMFEPREKRCYQTVHIHPDFSKISLSRDKTSLVICHHDAPYQKFFADEKFKNRVAFLTLVDPAGLVRIRNHAKRLWAIKQVLKDMSPDDAQYEKAREERTNIQTELFMALRSVYARLWYPLGDPSTGDSKLTDTTLLDSFTEDGTGQSVKFEGDKNSSKGELVIESTLRAAHKFQIVPPAAATERVKSYRVLRTRVENFLFPSTGRATWEQILDSAATRGLMVWAEPGTLERMKDTLLTAGEWREQAGQIMKPPFVEEATASIEYERDEKTGKITTTDIKLLHADSLYVTEDGAAEKRIKHDEAYVSEAMLIVFQAKDSTGRNKDGKPTRIENRIAIRHDFLPATTPGHRTLKLGVVPKDATVKWTSDGSDPANHGAPYPAKGIEVKEGGTVKVFAEKATAHAEVSIPVPKEKVPDDDDGQPTTTGLDLDKPATLASGALRSMDLVSRLNVHGFLTKLPNGSLLAGCRAKTVKAETDNRVAISWDAKTRLEPDKVLRSFDFLDTQLPDAEWELEATGGIVFPTGRALIEWQKENSIKIAPNLVTQ